MDLIANRSDVYGRMIGKIRKVRSDQTVEKSKSIPSKALIFHVSSDGFLQVVAQSQSNDIESVDRESGALGRTANMTQTYGPDRPGA